MPDDIQTRFRDVWGQDHVLERVKENIVFLENPEAIESRGGHVPGGILLWGPPGTGKRLMAEAVAGETGKPFVFVDPGAFINMFFGVGVLKVKALFRKLRKLALRGGDRLLRRGRLPRQPRPGHAPGFGGAAGWRAAGPRPDPARELGVLLQRPGLPRPCHPAQLLRSGGAHRDGLVVAPGMGGGGVGILQALLTELSGLPRGFVNRYLRRLLGLKPKPPPKYRFLVHDGHQHAPGPRRSPPAAGSHRPHRQGGLPLQSGRVRTYWGYFDRCATT